MGDLRRGGDLAQGDAELELLRQPGNGAGHGLLAWQHAAQHGGIRRARRHQVGAHAEGGQLQPHRLGQAGDRRLGGAVGRHLHARHMGGVGADGDDGTALLPLEVGHQGPQQIEDAAGVDRHAVVPVIIAQGVGRTEAQHPGPVHQHIEPAVRQQRCAAGVDRLRVADIEQPGGIGVVGFGKRQVQPHHGCAGRHELRRYLAADATPGPGHPDPLASEIKGHCLLLLIHHHTISTLSSSSASRPSRKRQKSSRRG
ncbi:hypothetical protein D3C79_706500 [compost metagenome]